MTSIKPKIKQCRVCNEDSYLFSRGRCKPCSQKEDYKPIPRSKTLKEKPIQINTAPVKQRKSKDDKSIPELIKLAVIVFHKWIKKRDSFDGYFYCISCGKLKGVSQMQAGHYIAGTNSPLRFNEYNVHGECEGCNCFDPNHLIGYRINLINKIGLQAVEQLETEAKLPFKWEREYLLDIINKYK